MSVRDEIEEIGKALEFVMEACDVVITSGGLGPTHDDMTLKAIAISLGLEVSENADALAIVERQYKTLYEKGIVQSPDLTEAGIKMARIPESAVPLDNKVGGAPGVRLEAGNSTIFSLPGVQSELKFIFEDSVIPWISDRVSQKIFEQVVEFGMHDESTFTPAIDVVMKKHPGVYVKSMPKTYGTKAIQSLEEETGLSSKIVET